jgi:hypothetical protein
VVEHLVHNERVKLQASGLNGLAVVCLATGIVQNIFVFAVGSINGQGVTISPSIAALFLPTGMVLHVIANLLLGQLKEKGE